MRSVPSLSVEYATEIVGTHYGLDATLAPLPSERDQNFSVRATDGRRFVLKIANARDGAEHVLMQVAALRHLSATAGLQRVIPTVDGTDVATVKTQADASTTAWLVTWVPGVPMARAGRGSSGLLRQLGRTAADISLALQGFDHPLLSRDFHWRLDGGLTRAREYQRAMAEPTLASQVDSLLSTLEERLPRHLELLPRGPIHGDLNDHNVLVQLTAAGMEVSGVLDFGDLVGSYRVAELAVAVAYAMLDEADPFAAAGEVVAGFTEKVALDEAELDSIYGLACLRLCLSAGIGAAQRGAAPENDYLGISQEPIARLLPLLNRTPYPLATALLRHAAGSSPLPDAQAVPAFLAGHRTRFAPILDVDLRAAVTVLLDLGVGSPLVRGNSSENEEEFLTARIADAMVEAGAEVAVGRYNEPRLLYTADFFGNPFGDPRERRTVHIGLDLFAPAGTPVHAPLDGEVVAVAINNQPQDYGPVVLLRHAPDAGPTFMTLYGHLSVESIAAIQPGRMLRRGERFAALGSPAENVAWTPHLHLQVIVDDLGLGTDFPGVAPASQRDVWCALSPDPTALAGLSNETARSAAEDQQLIQRRRKSTGGNIRLSYSVPVHARRGWMQYLYDAAGRRYLDCYNNVPHVGHSHPEVVRAVTEQLQILNTNTRYLHESLEDYAESLASLLPAELNVCYFVNSGTEANELAVRMARVATGRRDLVVLESAYHGISSGMIDLSPYKHAGPGGSGPPPWVHVAPVPDDFRGEFRRERPDTGVQYARRLGDVLSRLTQPGMAPAAFLAETCPSVAGQIMPPTDYFRHAYELVRAAGALCIADEVQTGLGRLGTWMWAFERYGVVPDIVVLGKPIGNGYPLGAVVTTRAIAAAFDNGMEFFSTFGGSTASCVAGGAVLRVLQDEGLQARAEATGGALFRGLQELSEEFDLVGDVRGAGLFLGMELVCDPESREPASDHARLVVDRMRQRGVLLGTDGPSNNVIKIRPPMQFNEDNADELLSRLSEVLAGVSALGTLS